MNKEIIKAMNRKEKKHPIKDWWKKNGYKVLRVILFPVWVFALGMDKIQKKLNARQKWSEKRAKEIFDYYVPRKAEWSEEDKTFYFFDNGMGWGNLAKKYLKLKDRRFWDNHRGFWGGKLRTYLIDEYRLEGFTKEIGNCSEGWTEISFTKIDE
jgi:hypothetical protein